MRIDWWTLALQTVNVLILMLDPGPVPVPPGCGDHRGAAGGGGRSSSPTRRRRSSEANAAREAAEAEAAQLGDARDEALRQAAADGGDGARRSARRRPHGGRAAARRPPRPKFERERHAEAAAASDRAARLAVDIAGKLLTRLPDSARVDGFVDGLADGARVAAGGEPGRARRGGEDARLKAARPLTRRGIEIVPRRLRQGARPAARLRRSPSIPISSPGSSSRRRTPSSATAFAPTLPASSRS